MSETYQKRFIPESVCNQAIDLLFQDLPKESEKRFKLIKFISKEFANLNCCVLYRFSEDFAELCKKLKLDLGKQEVIIRDNYSVCYSETYEVSPINLLQSH